MLLELLFRKSSTDQNYRIKNIILRLEFKYLHRTEKVNLIVFVFLVSFIFSFILQLNNKKFPR